MQHNNGNEGNPRGGDPEDLRIPTSSPFLNRGAMGAGGPGAAGAGNHPMGGHPGMGSALLDTYLSMIAAAGGDSATMAAALGSFPGRAAAFAAQAAAMGAGGGGGNPGLGKSGDLKANGKDTDDQRSVSEDREDEAIASDADISDTEDGGPDSAKPQTNDEDSIAAEDNWKGWRNQTTEMFQKRTKSERKTDLASNKKTNTTCLWKNKRKAKQ